MATTATAATTRYFTPAEASPALDALLALINAAQHSLRVIMYAFDHPLLVDALCAAHTRGVDVQIILDHSQSTGPSEVAMLHRLMLTIPPTNIRIGTSPVAHQIIHMKVLVTDALQTAEGSLNWSPSAFKQINDVVVTVSTDVAAAYLALFDEHWQWLSQHEPAYQPAAA